MNKVIVHRNAAKYLKYIPKKEKQRIKNILKQLEHNSLEYPGVKHMVGEWSGYHRIRSGKFRIIFWLDEIENVLYVDHIGPRGDIYK